MTEAEWLAATNPTPLLMFLRGRISERKLRLFGCACCRRVWHRIAVDESKAAVQLAERFADGEASLEQALQQRNSVQAAIAVVRKSRRGFRDGQRNAPAYHASMAPSWALAPNADLAWHVSYHSALSLRRGSTPPNQVADEAVFAELRQHATLLRDIAGNPFSQPSSVNRALLSWGGGMILDLATSIYVSHAFDRIPLLADALEDAGCTDAELLGHLRGPGPHVRGCWAVDVVLGKE